MAKIPLTIDPGYCQTWGFWEGIRELIQNAKDAEEYEDLKMEVKHYPQTNKLTISTEGAALTANLLLLLGASSKKDGGQRGKFGEGFAIGVLALVRAGHPVTIYNADEVWRPTIEEPDDGHPFEGSKLLVFNTRALRSARKEFRVEIENVSREVWAEARKLFLFLSPPKTAVEVYDGKVLLDKEHQGMVFCRGIFVTKYEELDAGYDIPGLELDRDRRAVDEWNLKYRTSALWASAASKNPEAFEARLYRMAKEERLETRSLVYHADNKLLAALRKSFEEENGTNAIAVSTTGESQELTRLGAKTVVVPKTLSDLLAKTGPSREAIKEKLKGRINRTLDWADLSDRERSTCESWVAHIAPQYSIVEFNDDEILCRYDVESGQMNVNRRALDNERLLLVELARQESLRPRRGKPEEVLAELLLEIREQIRPAL
jgi:siroheme synthase (precorrin-2 oxidase/ferrochelatase)